MLDARDIVVRLAGKAILSGVSFRAIPGQITAIVGPNGSGKTTLLRAFTQEVAYDGAIAIGGADIAGLAGWQLAARRAVLPQSSRIAFPFTVLEIVRLGLTASATPAHDGRPLDALARVGLAGFEGRFYQELSGGEQQRVQLARVLAQVWDPVGPEGPRWLFLDEPVASLDIAHQLEVMGVLTDYAAAGGGVIAVMHDLNLTAVYARDVAVLSGGAILAQGPPTEILGDDLLSRAYGCTIRTGVAPNDGTPFVLPHMASL
ncbi:MAG: heme ABC transporter ATP-binding protein [Pseudomonadota bacterium]